MREGRVSEILLKRWMSRHAPLVATSASAAGAGRPSKVTRRELDTELVYGSGSCAVGRIRNAFRSGRLPCPSGIISTSPAAETLCVSLLGQTQHTHFLPSLGTYFSSKFWHTCIWRSLATMELQAPMEAMVAQSTISKGNLELVDHSRLGMTHQWRPPQASWRRSVGRRWR